MYSRPAFSVSGKSTNTVFSSRSYLSVARPEHDLVDVQVGVQIELNARVVLQHPEADAVLAGDELLLGIDADVEVIGEQIVVGAIPPVFAAQDVGARRWPQRRRRRRARALCEHDGRRHCADDRTKANPPAHASGRIECMALIIAARRTSHCRTSHSALRTSHSALRTSDFAPLRTSHFALSRFSRQPLLQLRPLRLSEARARADGLQRLLQRALGVRHLVRGEELLDCRRPSPASQNEPQARRR